MKKFSADGVSFKKTQVDLQRLKREEREDEFRRGMHNLLQKKRDASERHNARRLERLIIEQKSNQLNSNDAKEQVSIIENEDPALYEELSMRRKWSNVSKDPTKGLKDEF